MKLLKNKTIIGIIAIVFGILICFILTPLYTKSLEAKTKVIQIDKTIEKGKLIEEEDIKVVEVGSYNLPDDVIRSKEEVIGKYAAIEMYPSEYIIPKKLSSLPLSKDEYLMDLDGTKSAVSITLQSFAAGLSGKLLSGDIVSIITTDSNTNETHIPEELKYVKVLASTTAKGNDVDEDTKNKEDTEEETLPSTVTLLVNDRQAQALANLEVTQKVHIELVYRGTEEDCNVFLEQQQKIMDEMEQAATKEKSVEGKENTQDVTDSVTDINEKATGDDDE